MCMPRWVAALVQEGALDPSGDDVSAWRFSGGSLSRVQAAMRLQHDLGVNLSGIALVLELLDELQGLRERLSLLNIQTLNHLD